MQRRVGGLRALASLLHAQPGEQLSRSLRGLHASTSASAATGFAPGTTKPTPRNGVDPPYVAKLSANRPAPVIMEEMEPSEPAHVHVKPIYRSGTHIVCTLGPSSRSVEHITSLLERGMSIARFNFSHGSHDYHWETLQNLRTACERGGHTCGVLLDTKGPEVRTGRLRGGGPVTYTEGSQVTVTTNYDAEGDETTIALSLRSLAAHVRPGNHILMADGALTMRVEAVDTEAGTVTCRALNTATVGERKNCNLPGVKLDLPILMEKDKQDIMWGLGSGMDFLAVSFCQSAADVRYVREFLGRQANNVKIIAKIENQQGVDEIEDIISEADGVMVARGDLGMEVPLEKLINIQERTDKRRRLRVLAHIISASLVAPAQLEYALSCVAACVHVANVGAQKRIIRLCNRAGVPVITATQMLESMCHSPRPTRAEATDVANAVLDGTDCVMLSGETAAGRYPAAAVKIMGRICEEAERSIDGVTQYKELIRTTLNAEASGTLGVTEAMASSTAVVITTVGAKCIIVLAGSGKTARIIAKYRPGVPIVVGVMPRNARTTIGNKDLRLGSRQIARHLLLTRGLIPTVLKERHAFTFTSRLDAAKAYLEDAMQFALEQGILRRGEYAAMLYSVEDDMFVQVAKAPPLVTSMAAAA